MMFILFSSPLVSKRTSLGDFLPFSCCTSRFYDKEGTRILIFVRAEEHLFNKLFSSWAHRGCGH